MSTWNEFAEVLRSSPPGPGAVHLLQNHTMATLRRDGSPRISGNEVQFRDGQFRFGVMPGARRGWDLRRDPRLAIHSHSVDPPEDDPNAWPGEAKASGLATELDPGTEPGGSYQVAITEVALTYLDGHLIIEHWTAGRGVVRPERR